MEFIIKCGRDMDIHMRVPECRGMRDTQPKGSPKDAADDSNWGLRTLSLELKEGDLCPVCSWSGAVPLDCGSHWRSPWMQQPSLV